MEQEAAAKAAEERKKAEEIAAKAAEEAKAAEAEQAEQEGGVEGNSSRETVDKPEEDSVAGEEDSSEPAPTADTPAESGQNEPADDPEPVEE